MFNHPRLTSGSKSTNNKGDKSWLYITGILLFILFMYVFGKISQYALGHKDVKAVDLSVNSQIELIQGENISVIPSPGRMIIPVAGEGTYMLDMQLTTAATLPLSKISNQIFSYYALSHDANKLAGVNRQGIYILDLVSGQLGTLVEGNNESVFYEEPYWAPDNKTLYLTRRTQKTTENMQSEVLSADIMQISVDGKEINKVTDGTYPTVSADQLMLFFTREGHMFKRNLQSGQEEDLGVGSQPTLSPDGKYLACVKQANGIADVYVISLKKPNDMKKITHNISAPASSGPNISNSGFYKYYKPAWGNDSLSLYFSRAQSSAPSAMTIRRIKLSGTENTAKENINSWLAARVNQDEEVMQNLSDNLEIIGTGAILEREPQAMAITDSGREGTGLYVDVQSTFVNPEIPSYQITKEHFSLENELPGYRLKKLQLSTSVQYYGKADGLYKLEKGQEEKLLDLDGNSLSLVSYNQAVDKMVYLVKEKDKANYQIKSYNLASKKTEAMDSAIPIDTRMENIGYSYSGQLMSVQFNHSDQKTVYVYNLKEQKIVPVPFLQDIKSAYWLGNNMKVYSGNDNFILQWNYDPGLGSRYL